jgi:hypothetical protein
MTSIRGFLSSPLLATMMLITFREFADIPEKIHLFYDQAFDALFSKHDATKEGFKRKLYTDIPSDEFKKILSYLCLVSYYDQKYEFKIDELKAYVKKGLSIDEISLDVDSFVKDLLESICIMQKDGIPIVFSHRTFQEFFSAFCLARYSIKHVRKILLKFANRPSDSVIQMLFDMNQELVDVEFVIPTLKEIVGAIRKLPKSRPFFDYMALFHPSLVVHFDPASGPRILIIQGQKYEMQAARTILRRLYPAEFPWRRDSEKYDEMDRKLGRRLIEQGIVKEKGGMVRSNIKLRGRAAKNKADPDIYWLEESGSAAYYLAEKGHFAKLKAKIEKRRANRIEKIEDLLGVS